MKNGTVYAARLKKAYAKLRSAASGVEIPEPDDPLRRLAIGILGVGCPDEQAERAVDRALNKMVDWNEIRVSSAFELNKATGNAIPKGTKQCQRLIDALHDVYDRENTMSLDRLRSLGRREARHYLEALKGVDAYAVASTLLWSLSAHAIPVNEQLLTALRQADLVHPEADRAEVQAFLERNISAAEARRFCLTMRNFTGSARSRTPRSKATASRRTRKA